MDKEPIDITSLVVIVFFVITNICSFIAGNQYKTRQERELYRKGTAAMLRHPKESIRVAACFERNKNDRVGFVACMPEEWFHTKENTQ